MTVQLLLLSATALAAFACAQETRLNPELEIETCSSLSCNDTESSGLCSGDGDREGRAIGVGFVPDFLPVSNSDGGSNLSLTLIDGEPSGAGFPYQFTTKSFLVGAPPGIDLRDQPPTCGLLMQYQGQTFPAYQSEPLPNTTNCPAAFTGGADPFCLDRLKDTIQNFEYDSAQMLPRCEALAHFVEASIRAEAREYGFCFYYSALVSVYGGPLTGPDVGQPANGSIVGGSCQPAQSQEIELHHVVSAEQVLHSNSSVSELTDMGGRTGFTPIVTVAYSEDDSTDPSVASFCLHVRSREGFELPFQHANFEDEATTSSSQSIRPFANRGILAFYILLIFYVL
ncbi:hypothetical protein NU219Hw_g8727t1 [Hortaea werneckii]